MIPADKLSKWHEVIRAVRYASGVDLSDRRRAELDEIIDVMRGCPLCGEPIGACVCPRCRTCGELDFDCQCPDPNEDVRDDDERFYEEEPLPDPSPEPES